MEDILSTSDMNELLSILEEATDEVKAVELLKELNESNKELGKLLLNNDPSLSHDDWEKLCTKAKYRVDQVILEIKHL